MRANEWVREAKLESKFLARPVQSTLCDFDAHRKTVSVIAVNKRVVAKGLPNFVRLMRIFGRVRSP